jgi:hypothetical protein
MEVPVGGDNIDISVSGQAFYPTNWNVTCED